MMFGGLKKSASRLALVAAAGVLSTNAYAADLGGDCCADLEERVAELEATTARKGTRKTSLEVYGHVNKIIVGWNDGISKNIALGEDNVNHSTRFGFRGNAKVSPQVSAGYSIVIEQATGGRSTNINQFQDKGAISGASGNSLNGYRTANFGANDAAITMREANWWIESKTLGRATVGRFVGGAGPQGTIDLGGIGLTAASGSMSLIGTGLAFRTNQANVGAVNAATANTVTKAAAAGATFVFDPKTGLAAPSAAIAAASNNFTGYTIGNTTDAAGQYSTRQNGLQYTSPVLAGFTVTASYSGSSKQDDVTQNALGQSTPTYGPLWAVGLKYAGEFSGIRVAAAAGYEDAKGGSYTSLDATNGTSTRADSTNKGLSLSLMHVATGLFAQGFYNEYTRGHDNVTTDVNFIANNKDTAKQYMIQAGINKNWFGIGNTSVYGEYGNTKNGFNTFGQTGAGNAPLNGLTNGGVAYQGDNTTNKMWGLGIVQNVDAAAMEVYAGYRNFSLSSDNCTAAGGCKDIGMFTAGSKIRF
jgi:hypothetical protein